MAADMWASGARSPEAPTEPWAGITGSRSSAAMRSKVSMTCQRMPEAPRARLPILSAMIRRTKGAGRAGPVPAEWEAIRLTWRVERSPVAMRWRASLPKPVLTP